MWGRSIGGLFSNRANNLFAVLFIGEFLSCCVFVWGAVIVMAAGSLLECSIHAELEKYQFPNSAACFPGDHPFGDFLFVLHSPHPPRLLGRPSLPAPCLWV